MDSRYQGGQQIRMLGSASATLSSDGITVERFPSAPLLIAKTGSAVVTVANAMDLPAGTSMSITGGSLDLGAAANNLTIPSTLTLATGTSVKLSGATLTANGAVVPAGPYSNGNIIP
ncbi:MAG: hypothetical protein EOP05_12660 [Proteobacteria bacterium]|nr:MAG: hypothetical protein EOP05_12660 [Pseudomonadota bacterium]